MKRAVLIIVVLALLAAGIFAVRAIALGARGSETIETQEVTRGRLDISVQADGVIESGQSAELAWKTSGTVARVDVQVGQVVRAGDVLAELETTSLPQEVILARADLIQAQRDLDDLQTSQMKYAQALQAVDQAEQDLEAARNPVTLQADAQETLAQAQKAVDNAQRDLAILMKRPPQSAIDQAYANLLLAERKYELTKFNYDRIQRRLAKPADQLYFFESQSNYRKILRQFEVALLSDKRNYEEAQDKYDSLLEPVDATDKEIAEGKLALAQAQLEQAQREYARIEGGTSPADLAVFEARLEDARRELARWQDGPDPAEVAAAEARLEVAKSVLARQQILAPFDGVVTQVSVQVGDRVSTSLPAFRIDNLQPLYASLQVSEIEIPRIEVGQEVSLSLDAIPEANYSGKVVFVSGVGNDIAGGVNFEVSVELISSDEGVRPGMTTSASIVTAALEDVLSVSNRAIRFVDGERVVYKLQNDKFVPVQISVGAASDTLSQVIEGDLQAGDEILLNPDEGVLQAANAGGSPGATR